MSQLRIIISGGGTGGHIFPAIAIADAIKALRPDTEILFVGAEGRMEMEKVPQAGYKIIGLKIAGLQRRLTVKNLGFPFKLISSLVKARKIVKDFKPDAAVGVGGYASGPLLRSANRLKIPTLIQEQNSYPGITNKILGKSARKICVAYQGMEKFFAADKLILTGNPIRKGIDEKLNQREEAIQFFGLDLKKKTVLVIGGSLGARTINDSIAGMVDSFPEDGQVQMIWQTGKQGVDTAERALSSGTSCIKAMAFIQKMDLAYAAADVIVSRAGAMSISELCLVGKPAILVPSPNVSEDHQTKNAMALVNSNAAIMVKDIKAREELKSVLFKLLDESSTQSTLADNIKKLSYPLAAQQIAAEVIALVEK